jgi:hypothetical protein
MNLARPHRLELEGQKSKPKSQARLAISIVVQSISYRAPVLPVSATDAVLERIAWVLAAAVAGLLVREAWRVAQERSRGRQGDRMMLTALAREVLIIKATAAAIIQDINRERALLREEGRWRLKPLMTLPTSIYEMARQRIPGALLEQEDGFVQLIGLQTQCAFMNRLAEEHQRWKSPEARRQADQLEVIIGFHAPLEEAIRAVIRRCDCLVATLEASAQTLGGLQLRRGEAAPDPALPDCADHGDS